MKHGSICIIETLSYIPITMETPCVGVTSNYSPHQSSQHLKNISSNAEQVLSGTIYMNPLSPASHWISSILKSIMVRSRLIN